MFTKPFLSSFCGAAALALLLLSGCATDGGAAVSTDRPGGVNLAAQTPESVHATPADYAGNDCEALERFLPVMQQGLKTSAGFAHKVYGWHQSAIEQVQRDKGCAEQRSAAGAARASASGQIGAELQPVTPADARALGLDAPRGALVAHPASGGPAERAGLRPRDVIVEVAGQRVQTPAELKSIVGLMAPGFKTSLRVWRERAMVDLTVEIAAPPAAAAGSATAVASRSR